MPTDTTIQQVQYPQWIEQNQQQLLNSIYGVTDPATGVRTPGLIDQATTVPQQQVQGFTQPQQDAFTLAHQGIGGFRPYLQSALGQQFGAAGTTGQGIQALQGMSFDPDVSQYMDPWQKDVTQEALKEIDRQSAMAGNQLAGQAVGAGAFGGSRYGLQQSELARSAQDLRSRRIFEDLSRNYQQAQGAMQAANQQQLQQGQAFGQLGQATSGIAGAMAGLGGQAQAMGQSDVNQLMGIGGLQQQQAQRGFDVNTANLQALQNAPYQQLSTGAGIMQQLIPNLIGQQTVAPLPQTNPYLQAAGAIGGMGVGLGSLLR